MEILGHETRLEAPSGKQTHEALDHPEEGQAGGQQGGLHRSSSHRRRRHRGVISAPCRTHSSLQNPPPAPCSPHPPQT